MCVLLLLLTSLALIIISNMKKNWIFRQTNEVCGFQMADSRRHGLSKAHKSRGSGKEWFAMFYFSLFLWIRENLQEILFFLVIFYNFLCCVHFFLFICFHLIIVFNRPRAEESTYVVHWCFSIVQQDFHSYRWSWASLHCSCTLLTGVDCLVSITDVERKPEQIWIQLVSERYPDEGLNSSFGLYSGFVLTGWLNEPPPQPSNPQR